MQKYRIFCQFRSKLAITHTIAVKWKKKYDAVVVDCHHSLCLCDDRMKISIPKKIFFLGRPTSISRLFHHNSCPLAYSLVQYENTLLD